VGKSKVVKREPNSISKPGDRGMQPAIYPNVGLISIRRLCHPTWTTLAQQFNVGVVLPY
jgi:hypothetical protein